MKFLKWKLWLERGYPGGIAFLTTLSVFFYLFKNRDLSSYENFDQALAGNLTISGLIIGFLGAVMPVIISMRNDSQLVKFIFEKDTNQLFLKYTKSTLLIGLVNTALTIFMFFIDNIEKQKIRETFSVIWLFMLLWFLVLTYRSMSCMLKVIFIRNPQ